MFNVCDIAGKHLGFVCGKSARHKSWQIALCDNPIDNSRVKWDFLKLRLADHIESRNFWGKIQEETLLRKAREEWQQRFAQDVDLNFNPSTDEDYLKFMFLIFASHEIKKGINLDGLDVKGYVLMDNSGFRFHNKDNLLLDLDPKSITERVMDHPPLYGIIADIPKIYLSVMGFAEGFFLGASWADYGGRNHTHTTVAQIRSGNVDIELRFPIQIAFKKGEPIQIFLAGSGQITSIYYDGVIYVINAHPDDDGTPTYSFDTTDS